MAINPETFAGLVTMIVAGEDSTDHDSDQDMVNHAIKVTDMIVTGSFDHVAKSAANQAAKSKLVVPQKGLVT
jgi:hypothetical protein